MGIDCYMACDLQEKNNSGVEEVSISTLSIVFLAVAYVIFFSGAKLQNFRPQYLGQSMAYGHATDISYRGRDPLPPIATVTRYQFRFRQGRCQRF